MSGRLKNAALWTWGAVSLVLLLLIAIEWFRLVGNPEVVVLVPEPPARWIRFDRNFGLHRYPIEEIQADFRILFEVEVVPPDAELTVYALRRAEIFLDGARLPSAPLEPAHWKEPLEIPLTAHLTEGEHELRISVRNERGPLALLAHSKQLGLFTGRDWEARMLHWGWRPAVLVEEKRPPDLTRSFPSVAEAVRSRTALLAAVFLLGFGLTLGFERLRFLQVIPVTPGRFRWLILLALGALGLNNIGKIPLNIGFDVQGHLEYVQYVAQHGALPLAEQGWQMFQAPLYYVISAPLYWLLELFSDPDTTARMLRVVPLLCAATQAELCYRALRRIYPHRADLQRLGTLIGGLMPMSLYVSQYIGNEPLAGVLSAGAVVMALRLAAGSEPLPSPRWQAGLGVLLGLAILAKTTAVLLVPPVLVLLALAYRGRGWKSSARTCSRLLLLLLLVAGWFSVRNWLAYGKPFVGGWDPVRGIQWWQDPGFRLAEDFLSFGSALVHPIMAAFAGFWDGVYSTLWLDGYLSGRASYQYRPPWNYSFVLTGAWLGLGPSLALVLGCARALRVRARRLRGALLFCVGCLSIYFVALALLYLELPIYSTAKATYTLGLLPCYALLVAGGLEVLVLGAVSRALLSGLMTCWAVFSYLAYFVV